MPPFLESELIQTCKSRSHQHRTGFRPENRDLIRVRSGFRLENRDLIRVRSGFRLENRDLIWNLPAFRMYEMSKSCSIDTTTPIYNRLPGEVKITLASSRRYVWHLFPGLARRSKRGASRSEGASLVGHGFACLPRQRRLHHSNIAHLVIIYTRKSSASLLNDLDLERLNDLWHEYVENGYAQY